MEIRKFKRYCEELGFVVFYDTLSLTGHVYGDWASSCLYSFTLQTLEMKSDQEIEDLVFDLTIQKNFL